MEKTEKNPVINETVSIVLRLASPDDMKQDKKNLKMGQPFWVKSMYTGKFDNKNLITNKDTDVAELALWLTQKMVWIPETLFPKS